MREVILCFLDIESNMLRSSWLNSWAAKLAPKSQYKRPPMVHVELFFRSESDSNEGHCTSIVYNKKIHWFKKKFSRQWSFRSIWMEEHVYAKLKAYCLQHVGCGFNKIGFFLMGFGISFPGSFSSFFGFRQRFFCSEYISAALLHCQLLPPKTKRCIHPQRLYEIIAPFSSITTIKHYGANEISYDI